MTVHKFARKSIQVEVGDSFMCPCGETISTSNAYLAAHWYEPMSTTCPNCKQPYNLKAGRVSKGRKR